MYRKRMRLGQKQVAYLMGLKSVAHISHYERGLKLPRLENAIKLEVILNVPVSFIFPELTSRVRKEIHAKRKELNRFSPAS
ncbi:helix-turn-helix domain-containing protein [Acidobacteria bacterium AH-259-A15]|nr:helix-turn-helix domain-containing protein [Acidobacteria bacterium AH-259-A15]